MRVLFTSIAAKAHIYLQVPLAWALSAAGHEVRMASHPDGVDDITRAGLAAVPVGAALDQRGQVQELRERERKNPSTAEPFGEHELLRMDELRPERLTYDFLHGVFTAMTATIFQNFCSARMIDDLVAFSRDWQPDLVIWDTMTFAGAVAARACGASHARMLIGLDLIGRMRERYMRAALAQPPELLEDPMAEWLGWTLDRYDGTFTEDLVVGQWTLDPTPPWMQFATGYHYVPVRHVPYNGPAVMPDWLRKPPERRRVCLTLGVSFREVMGGDQVPVSELLAAVADLDVEVVATLTDEQLAAVPRVPRNVRAAGFVPLNELLPSCAAIVHQGGTGTLQTALAHGIPQIIVPTRIWDNTIKARKMQDSGAALYAPDSGRLTAEVMRAMLRRVLEEPSFAWHAERLRVELTGTPAPSEIVPVLERLTATHRTTDGIVKWTRQTRI